jgi:hypothetical protein
MTNRRFIPAIRAQVALAITLAVAACTIPPLAMGQNFSAGTIQRKSRASSPTTVCQDPAINAQVKEALRLVCAERGTIEERPTSKKTIIIGFLGGFAKENDANHPEVWFGSYLRERFPSAVDVEVFPNHQGRKAVREIMRLLDTDHDGVLTDNEKRQARIIIYGHSWGASETTALAKELGRNGIPVLLTVQIDIVPKPNQQPVMIPSNVERAINFYQHQPKGFLHGRSEIIAEDPTRTKIIGNVRMTYDDQPVDCHNYPWFPRTFNKPHHEIENDAHVWYKVASLIDSVSSIDSLSSSVSAPRN